MDETTDSSSKNETSFYETISSGDESEDILEKTSDKGPVGTATGAEGQRRSARTPKPIIRKDFITYLITEKFQMDPETVKEALQRSDKEHWRAAIEEERDSLVQNQTWTLTDLPKGKKTLDTKWVLKTNRNVTGKIKGYKARLVVRGCKQSEGIACTETYAPVIRYTSVRSLCALAVKYNLKMH